MRGSKIRDLNLIQNIRYWVIKKEGKADTFLSLQMKPQARGTFLTCVLNPFLSFSFILYPGYGTFNPLYLEI